MQNTELLLTRFFKKVNKTDSCWKWTGGKDKIGYGFFFMGGQKNGSPKMERAHRASWMLHNGPIPEGLRVLHKCDVPGCVRPEHLFLGTQRDNVIDCYRKGRANRPDQKGENNYYAKLTKEQVMQIKALSLSRQINQKEIARRFTMSESSISQILHRKRWSDAG